MANKKTLVPQAHVLTSEERSKGGQRAAVYRKEKKAMKTILNDLLTMPLQETDIAELSQIKSLTSLKGQNISVQEAMCLAMVHKALKGDQKAFLSILDITGQPPGTDELESEEDSLTTRLEEAARTVWSLE